MTRTWPFRAVRATCALPPLILLAACGGPDAPAPTSAAKPEFRNMDPNVRYVGQETCRECHFEEFSTYSKTGMGRAFYPMAADDVVEDFQTDNEFVIEESGLHYRMEQRDGRFYQRQFLLNSAGEEFAVDERELLFVIGSNHHSRSYVTAIDDKLFQAPACWYPDEQKWELCPGYEVMNDHFGREISAGCIHCHNGVMELVDGERNRYKQPYPHGIGCERCHGPGELHVERWRTGETPTGSPDPTIVNVRRLPLPERVEVCFQCHLGDAKASERVMRWDRGIGTFRPGQRITEAVVPFRYEQQTQYGFGLTSQADRMILSRCYTASGGRLECLSCHNPHVTVYREDRPADFFRRACLSCHAEEDCAGEAHMRQQTAGATDDCVACHMRTAEPDDQRFTTFTDHWIRRDIDIREEDHRTRFEYEPIFPDRLQELTAGEQSFYRARAGALMASRTLVTESRPELWNKAQDLFEQSIEQGFDTVDAWFFLGKVRLNLGRLEQAEEAFERAVALEPTHHDANYALGQALARRGELPRALEVFRGLVERDPDDAMALAEMGRIVSMMGGHEEALEYFDRAIREEPWEATFHLNRGRVIAAMGDFAEAARIAKRVVSLAPDDHGSWVFYEKTHEAAGETAEAAEGRRIARRLAGIKNVGG